ncbi:MAG: hypothetical protein Q9173_003835 [Seirophora scorigena]
MVVWPHHLMFFQLSSLSDLGPKSLKTPTVQRVLVTTLLKSPRTVSADNIILDRSSAAAIAPQVQLLSAAVSPANPHSYQSGLSAANICCYRPLDRPYIPSAAEIFDAAYTIIRAQGGQWKAGIAMAADIQEQGEQSIQRRTSKKSSSHDRRGQIYPDDFRERTIRPVTPEIPIKTTPLRSDSDSDPPSPTSPPPSAPRPAALRRAYAPSVDPSFPSSIRREWQGLPNGSASASQPRPRTRTLEERVRDQSPPQPGTKTRQRIGSLQSGTNGGDHEHAFSIGYPSIIPSPPLDLEHREPRRRLIPSPPLDTEPRRRLVKPKSRPSSPVIGTHSVRSAASNSSSATDRLHPSVLDDEFCLAIYPQYTSSLDQSAHIFPVYLSLESRVLFEVWFVLLRAFTIPELYGPEQISINPHLVPAEVVRTLSRPPSPSADMFRVEKLLSLRIIEAKMFSPRRRHSRRASNRSQHQDQSRKTLLPGSYLAEVRLDGMVRGKTSVKYDTGNPFWREDFEFHDLPPVLSTACIEIKTRNPGQRDWTLVSDGPLDLERAQLDPLAIVGDIEISPLESTYGVVELQFEENDRVVKTEKWWSILNDADEVVGEVLMELRIEGLVVLMGRDYQPLSGLLHNFSNSLTVQIAAAYPPDLVRKLAEILLNIFQVSAQASEWLLSLVEEEIDNVHKETHHSKYRYGRRIASNDFLESGMEREMILRDLGKTAVVEANQLFRGNTLLTKALDCHMKRLGHDYLEETLGEKIRQIDESNPECEIDPNRVQAPEDLERNWRTLSALIESVWTSISESALRCPPELRLIFRHISACAEDRYGDFLRTVTYSSVSGFLFLRFFCPALLNPHLFGLLKDSILADMSQDHPRPQAQRTLTLISKTLNTLANLGTFGSKEPWMEPMNGFLNTHRQGFKSFVDTICSISPDHANSAIPPSYATPITILGRLPGTSREGFPSLPYLIDQAKECAALVDLWLDRPHHGDGPLRMSEELQAFNDMCEISREKTQHCLSRAEQAERPSGVLEPRWEELVEQMGRKARIRIANGQKSAELASRALAEEARRKARTRLESKNDSVAEAKRNLDFYASTQNSTTTSLVSSYMRRHNDDSRGGSKQGTPLVIAPMMTGGPVRDGDWFPPAADRMQHSRRGTGDHYDIDSTDGGGGTPPGSASGVWDPGVFRGLGPYTPVTASSGEDIGFGSEEMEADFREGGSSIYRIGTPSSSSRARRHHRQRRSASKPKSSGHSHRGGNRSAFSVDPSSELSNVPRRGPLSSRDGPPDAPPNGTSIYRLKKTMTSERQMEPIPRSGTPRSPGSRDGGKNLFGDLGSVFRKRAKEQERDEKGAR